MTRERDKKKEASAVRGEWHCSESGQRTELRSINGQGQKTVTVPDNDKCYSIIREA